MSPSTITSVAPASAGSEAVVNLPRLLDSDPNKYRSLKQVFVFGLPGSRIDAISEALKILGFKVYDFKAASDRHERDFPLWAEAARLRSEGKPYDKADYDKLIGDYNALVGAPTSFLGLDFVELYAEAKVILVTDQSDTKNFKTPIQMLNAWIIRKALSCFDDTFFSNISTFLELTGEAKFDPQQYRDSVRDKNLLEIDNFNDWNMLCDFLKVRVPEKEVPRATDNAVVTELLSRLQRLLDGFAEAHALQVVQGLQVLCGAAGVFLVAVIVAKVTQSASSVAVVLCTFIAIWYLAQFSGLWTPKLQSSLNMIAAQQAPIAVVQKPSPQTFRPEKPRQYKPKRSGNCRTKYNKPRSERANRPPPPTLPGWDNFHAAIKTDDKAKYEEKMAHAKKMAGQRLTFKQTYKETGCGSGKTAAITEENLE